MTILNTEIGRFAWMQQRQGRLNWREKVNVIQHTLWPTSKHIFHLFGKNQSSSQLQFEQIIIPDTSHVREAVDYVSNHLASNVLAHSWRSYYWGYAIANSKSLDFNAEDFLISALFHDVGLGQNHPEGCQCFCYHSALITQKWAQQQAYPPQRLALILDSICMHMNGSETPDVATEIQMLQWGTSCDVIGQHHHHIKLDLQQQIWQHFPADAFHQDMKNLIQFEAQHYPNSRSALLKQLGLTQLITLQQKLIHQRNIKP